MNVGVMNVGQSQYSSYCAFLGRSSSWTSTRGRHRWLVGTILIIFNIIIPTLSLFLSFLRYQNVIQCSKGGEQAEASAAWALFEAGSRPLPPQQRCHVDLLANNGSIARSPNDVIWTEPCCRSIPSSPTMWCESYFVSATQLSHKLCSANQQCDVRRTLVQTYPG